MTHEKRGMGKRKGFESSTTLRGNARHRSAGFRYLTKTMRASGAHPVPSGPRACTGCASPASGERWDAVGVVRCREAKGVLVRESGQALAPSTPVCGWPLEKPPLRRRSVTRARHASAEPVGPSTTTHYYYCFWHTRSDARVCHPCSKTLVGITSVSHGITFVTELRRIESIPRPSRKGAHAHIAPLAPQPRSVHAPHPRAL